VLILTSGALFFAIHSSTSLVSLLLAGYAGVAQLFPGVVLGLFSRRVTTAGVSVGLVTGLSIAIFLMMTGQDPYRGLNAGFIALCVNFAATGLQLPYICSRACIRRSSSLNFCVAAQQGSTHRIAHVAFKEYYTIPVAGGGLFSGLRVPVLRYAGKRPSYDGAGNFVGGRPWRK